MGAAAVERPALGDDPASVDYPDFAHLVCGAVEDGRFGALGIDLQEAALAGRHMRDGSFGVLYQQELRALVEKLKSA